MADVKVDNKNVVNDVKENKEAQVVGSVVDKEKIVSIDELNILTKRNVSVEDKDTIGPEFYVEDGSQVFPTKVLLQRTENTDKKTGKKWNNYGVAFPRQLPSGTVRQEVALEPVDSSDIGYEALLGLYMSQEKTFVEFVRKPRNDSSGNVIGYTYSLRVSCTAADGSLFVVPLTAKNRGGSAGILNLKNYLISRGELI